MIQRTETLRGVFWLVSLGMALLSAVGCRGVFSGQGFEDDTNAIKSSEGGEPGPRGSECDGVADRLLTIEVAALEAAPSTTKQLFDEYFACGGKKAPQVFMKFAPSQLALDRVWRVAVLFPSQAMSGSIARVLSQAIASKKDAALARAVVADAIRVNMVPDSYTFLRRSLTVSNSSAFVRAMLVLDPARASDDLLTHLAKLPLDVKESDKRRDVHSVVQTILEGLIDNPPSLQHPNFGHLFLFASSHHKPIASAAGKVILILSKKEAESVAVNFAKQSEDVQLGLLDLFLQDGDSRSMLVSLRERSPFEAVVKRLSEL